MIPQSFIQDLLARVDIVDVVGKHVRLKKAGANFLGLCPFHGEKSPSFTVSPAKQFYHCFGCSAHGSAIGFLMEHAGLGYVDAIHELAQSVGLQVPDDGARDPQRRHEPDLLEVNATAARFYKQRLKDSTRAVDYLKGRGVSGETAARFGIGYAPDSWRGLEAAFPEYGSPRLVEAGLVIEADGDGGSSGSGGGGSSGGGGDQAAPVRRKRYDRFRDRIMFPIRNQRGQVIGFGGRVVGAGEPKYLNSPETPLFSKGRELYGAFEARDAIRSSDCAIVVEGYMDVVMLAQHGVANAVATLGTATTPQHVQKLLRMVDRLVFAFDGDAAGRKAAWRALEACLPLAADTKRIEFLFLPPEHDPDSFVREHGADGFAKYLATALPLSEFMLRELSSRVDLATPEGRARFQADARPLLLAMPPAALRMQMVHAVAAKAGVPPDELLDYLRAEAATGERRRGGDGHGGRDGVRATGGDAHRAAGHAANPGRDSAAGWHGPGAAGGAAHRRDWPARDGRRDGWRQDGWRAAPRPSRAQPPDLQRKARLLLALHPALAQEAWAADFLPEGLVRWIARVAALPAGASFALLVESLRGEDPDLAARLERDAADDRGLLAELALEDARKEFSGALLQLRGQLIREESNRLVQAGLVDEGQRARFTELQALIKSLTASESA